MADFLTVVIGSMHTTVHFRFLNADCNRIRVYSGLIVDEYETLKQMNLFDGCSAEEFMDFIRWIDNKKGN